MSQFSTAGLLKSDIKTSFGSIYIRLSAVLTRLSISRDLWNKLISAKLIGNLRIDQDGTWCLNHDADVVATLLDDPERLRNTKGMTPDIFAEIQRVIKDHNFILEMATLANVFRDVSVPTQHLKAYSDLRRLTVHRYPMLLRYLGIDGALIPESEDRLHRIMLEFFDRIYEIQDFFDPQLLCPGSTNRYRESIDDVTTLLIEGLRVCPMTS